jgi:hypothetical protein
MADGTEARANFGIRWLRICYWAGAITDLFAVFAMMFSSVAAAVYGLRGFHPGADYRYAMGMGAALMLGWTAILIWADRKPIERKFVLVLTVFPVITGLIVSELLAVRDGFLPFAAVTPTLILQFALSAFFITAYLRFKD